MIWLLHYSSQLIYFFHQNCRCSNNQDYPPEWLEDQGRYFFDSPTECCLGVFNYENCDTEDICAGATTAPPTLKPTDEILQMLSKDVPSLHPYYPDLIRGTCLSDGKHSEYQINLFPTLDACVSLLACSSQSHSASITLNCCAVALFFLHVNPHTVPL